MACRYSPAGGIFDDDWFAFFSNRKRKAKFLLRGANVSEFRCNRDKRQSILLLSAILPLAIAVASHCVIFSGA